MPLSSDTKNRMAYALTNSAAAVELAAAIDTEVPGQIILPSGQIIVGTAGGVGAAVALSGNATMANTGAITVTSIGGLKIARGVHTQVAAADTIVTGLATVVACVASFRDAPSVKQMFIEASEGDQAGTPAAGSIIVSVFKPTSNVNDSTPTASTDLTENKKNSWIAIGT